MSCEKLNLMPIITILSEEQMVWYCFIYYVYLFFIAFLFLLINVLFNADFQKCNLFLAVPSSFLSYKNNVLDRP